jgi:hypothetical protein
MLRKCRNALVIAAVLFLSLNAANERAQGCPNCKEAVSLDAGEVTQMASGYNWSVLFMLAVPFSLLGTGFFMVRKAVRDGSLPEM